MLGQKIGEEKGRVTSRRVLPGEDPRYLKMEISFEAEGTVLGLQGGNIGTYTIFNRVGSQIYGEGQGIFMAKDGTSAIWNGHGVGLPTGDGMGVKFAFSVAYQADPNGPLAALNNVLVIGEHTAAGDGSATSTLYEWKA